jgi:hypothetical protein
VAEALRLRQHFAQLALEMDVAVILVVDFDHPGACWGMAIDHPLHVKRRAVILSKPPTTGLAYTIAMHELGHCVRGPGWSGERFLDREASAWEWALEHSILPRRLTAKHALDYIQATARETGVIKTESFERIRRKLRRALAG